LSKLKSDAEKIEPNINYLFAKTFRNGSIFVICLTTKCGKPMNFGKIIFIMAKNSKLIFAMITRAKYYCMKFVRTSLQKIEEFWKDNF